jgi:alpha-glucoside transport system substrate-binding protein
VAIQPALLAALIADTTSEPGALPMLQYTLTELYDGRRGGTMTAAAYESMGGLTGALVSRAESLFGALGRDGRAAAKQVFLRLVALNEGGGETRRRVLLSELKGIETTEGDLDEMLRAFGRHRLLSFDRDPASRAPTVEIAHETLIGAWSRLGGWIDEARADLRARARLTTATAEWVDEGENQDFLLAGASLDRYQTWVDDPPVRLTAEEKQFLEAGLAQEREREKVAQDQERQGSRLRRRTRALVGLGVVSALVVALALLAFGQRQRAQELADELEANDRAQTLVADSALVGNEDPELAILLAIAAIRATEDTGAALPEAVDALHWALQDSTVQYPADDADTPVAVRLHSTGARGVFALPPAELVEIGQQAVGRTFSSSECSRYFAAETCPDTRQPMADLDIAGGMEGYTGQAADTRPLEGTTVELTGAWGGDMATWVEMELNELTADLGVDVRHSAHAYDANPNEVPLGQDPSEISIISAPAAIPELAAERPLIDVGAYLGEQYLLDSYGDYLTSLISVGGRHHGVWSNIGAKSLLWYNPVAFEDAGYTEPADWQSLMTLSDQMVADGNTPFCLGVFSFDVTGWPATDWLETSLLLSEGPQFYDQWVAHQVPFDHPAVVAALERVGTMVHTPGYSPPRLIEETSWDEAWLLAGEDPPQCWLTPAPGFARGFFGEAPMAVAQFPRIDPAYTPAMLGAGDIALPLTDRPEVRAVMRAISGPEWGRVRAAEPNHDFVSPHRGFDTGQFQDPISREIAEQLAESVDAGMFRFDASDMMPYDIGFGPLLTELTDYVSDPSKSAQETLARVEEAWWNYDAVQ